MTLISQIVKEKQKINELKQLMKMKKYGRCKKGYKRRKTKTS